MGVVGEAMGNAGGAVVSAVEGALASLAATVGGASAGWLALGVALHLANQLARGRGWYAILRSSCGDEPALRRRDVLCAWVAGAGAGGVLSARGGDAVRVLLLSRRLPRTRSSVVAGTLVAEAAGDTLVGATVIVLAVALGAAPAFGLPGAETAAWAGGALALLALAAALVRRRGTPAPAAAGRLRRIVAGVGRGCAPLTHPRAFACSVLPWQAGSRGLRAAAIACFLAAFHLPAGAAAVLLVMLAQSGGRLLPLAPASAAASVAMLTAGFGPATGASVSVGAVAGFMVGMSTVLTLAGAVLAVAIVCLGARPAAAGTVPHTKGLGPALVRAREAARSVASCLRSPTPHPLPPAPSGSRGSPVEGPRLASSSSPTSSTRSPAG
jgi:Lysylphosphatidylglycerol synthase TM region